MLIWTGSKKPLKMQKISIVKLSRVDGLLRTFQRAQKYQWTPLFLNWKPSILILHFVTSGERNGRRPVGWTHCCHHLLRLHGNRRQQYLDSVVVVDKPSSATTTLLNLTTRWLLTRAGRLCCKWVEVLRE